MTATLGVDSADRTAGAAVAVDGTVVSEVRERSALRHSERLFFMVGAALAGAGIERTDLDCVAVTRGPGSFTGLRVGVAAAKGIAYALGIPVAGVSTLEAMARGATPFPGVVAPVLDARKRQIYGAAFDGRSGAVVLPEGAWEPDRLAEALAEAGRPTLLLGSGLEPYGERFARLLGDRFWGTPPARWAVPPGLVALLGEGLFREGGATPPAALTPAYHRLSEAEEARGAR